MTRDKNVVVIHDIVDGLCQLNMFSALGYLLLTVSHQKQEEDYPDLVLFWLTASYPVKSKVLNQYKNLYNFGKALGYPLQGLEP